MPDTLTIPESLLALELEAEAAYAALERKEAEERALADEAIAHNREECLAAARAQLPKGLGDYLFDTSIIWTARTSDVRLIIQLPGYYAIRFRMEKVGQSDAWTLSFMCGQCSDRLSKGPCYFEVELPSRVDRPRHCGGAGTALWSARRRV